MLKTFGQLFGRKTIMPAVVFNRNNSQSTTQRLNGKVAIVTASTEGIGFAIAERLANEGAKVVISSRKIKNVENAVKLLSDKGLSVHGLQCHVGNKEDRENLFSNTIDKYGGLDILVSNAAVNPHMGNVMDCSEEMWTKIFDINVKSSFLLCKEAVPLMQKRGNGSVVFISSIAGFTPMPMLGAYSVSKTALLGLCKVASNELAIDNIRVNCVVPGIIETKFSSKLTESDAVLTNVPLNRVGQPHEIASIVAFLVSDDASYVTGENIVASGGMISRL